MSNWTNYNSMEEAVSTFEGEIIFIEDETKLWTDPATGKASEKMQTHIMVKPLDHDISGPKGTGAYHEWLSPATTKNSKKGIWAQRLNENGIELTHITNSDLLGLRGTYQRVDIDVGTPERPYVLKDVLVPVKVVLKNKQQSMEPTPSFITSPPPSPTRLTVLGSASVPTSTDSSYDFSELVEKLKGDGMSQGQITRWAQKHGIPKTALSQFQGSLRNLNYDPGAEIYYIAE